jgi:hypothetical protein
VLLSGMTVVAWRIVDPPARLPIAIAFSIVTNRR